MSDFVRGSSSIARIELHVSYKVKYCHRVFDITEVRQRCEELFIEIAALQGIGIKEIGFDGDHVHMVIQIQVTQCVSQVSKSFKGMSGRKLLSEFPFLKKQFFWGSGLWGSQTYADSVGRDPEQIKSYVKNRGLGRKAVQLTNFMNTTGL